MVSRPVAAHMKDGNKRVIKVELVIKVFSTILLALSHFLDSNQVVNDLAEIAGGFNTPTIEDRLGKISVLL